MSEGSDVQALRAEVSRLFSLNIYYRKRLRQIHQRYEDEPDKGNPRWGLPWAMDADAREALELGDFDMWMRGEQKASDAQ